MLQWPLAGQMILAFAAALTLGGTSSLLLQRTAGGQAPVAALGPSIIPAPADQVRCAAPLARAAAPVDPVPIGGPFTLLGADGAAVTEAAFRGCYMLVFFGFTHCPDVCPAKLEEMARTLEALGPAARHVAPVFVSVDPERDTPEIVGDYVAFFDKRIVGLTGTADQVFETAKAYRAYYQRVDLDDGNYTMDHSAIVYFMGPEGAYRAAFRPDETPEQVAAKIIEILNRETN